MRAFAGHCRCGHRLFCGVCSMSLALLSIYGLAFLIALRCAR